MVNTKKIEDAAQKVLDDLGPYHKEGVYEEAMMHEFRCCDIPYERQRNVEIVYKGYTVGTRTPDCILNPPWSEQGEEEFLVEMKALANIKATQEKQVMVYLASMNIDKGAILNFNKNRNTIEFKEIQNPGKEFRKDMVFPKGTCGEVNKEILKQAGEEVIDYLGTEFFYDKSGLELYKKAVDVELRLQGLDFNSATYPVFYRNHHVTDYAYDYIFCNGEVANIIGYDKESQIIDYMKEFTAHNKRFGIEKGFVLALPKEEYKKMKKQKKKDKEKEKEEEKEKFEVVVEKV